METRHTAFRLSTDVLAILEEIARREQRSKRVVVDRAIRLYATRDKDKDKDTKGYDDDD